MAELKNTIVNGVLSVNGDAIASTIIKRGGADTHVLLAGGGTKAISDFATADVGTGYLPLTGGTMTGAITHPENKMALKFRTHASYETGLVYGTSGNEALTIAMQNPVTAFQIVYRTKPSDYGSGTWQSVTPLFQTKDDKVIINRKITQTSDTSSLKLLDVNGEMAATTIYENGTSLANKYAAKGHNHDEFVLKTELPPDYIKVEISTNTSTTSGTLSSAQLDALKANPHKTVLVWNGFYCFAENLSSSSTYYYSANCTFNGTTSIDKKVITLNTSSGAWSYSNYTYTNNTYGADRGISLKNGNFGHSNTAITAQSTKGLYKISYDAYGHITGTESFTLPTVNNGTLTIKTTGTGISASGTFTANQQTNSELSITLNSNSEGNRTVGQVVIAKDTGVIATDKLAISYNTSTKATWQYNASTDCVELIW